MNNQEKAFRKLSRLKVGALFMEMGTGKTKVAMDLIASKKNKIDYILWICPFSTKSDIEIERLKWHSDLEIDIIGFETLSLSDRIYLEIFEKVKTHRTFIIADESLEIKNGKAIRTERITRLRDMSDYRLILNGSPLSKNVLDLWSQMNFLSPKILNMTYDEFRNNYAEYYIRGRLKGLVKKQCNIPHLISLIKPYIFDCNLDLGKMKNYYSYSYSLANPFEYQEIKDKYAQSYCLDFMALSTELQRCFCGSKRKLEIVNQIISESEEQFIVYVKFLGSIPESAYCITGNVSEKDRKIILDDFRKGKIKVLYITYGCGTFGLNLQCCHNVIFAEHVFDYAHRIQSEARIYRIGQKYDVNYYDIKCDVGLERMITASQNKKSNLSLEIKKEIERVGKDKCLKNM